MRDEHQHDELLSAVFAEAAPEDFRRVSLEKTLRRMQYRRRQKRMMQAMVLTALLTAFAVLTRSHRPRLATTLATNPPVKVHLNYQLISTHPLPQTEMVVTQPLAANQIVASAITANLVQTRHGNYRTLNDDELLALVSHRPVALIRLDGTSESLLFVNPADENGFPVP